MDENFFRDTTGHFSKRGGLKKFKVATNCGLYAILDKYGRVIKIGYTTNFRTRRNVFYVGKQGLDPSCFVVILDFDCTNQALNDRMEQLYQGMCQELAKDEALAPFQRLFFEALRERGGEEIGGKMLVADAGKGLPRTFQIIQSNRVSHA